MRNLLGPHGLLICAVSTYPIFQHNHSGERRERILEVNREGRMKICGPYF